MSASSASLFQIQDLNERQIFQLFEKASRLSVEFFKSGNLHNLIDMNRAAENVVLLFFLEPSTRTRVSFEMAALRLGLKTLRFDDVSSSSLAKGESSTDTLFNLMAMHPNALVVRHGNDPELALTLRNLKIPVISGGQGGLSHPTQALLDVYTVFKEKGSIENKKILFVGDVKHGRAALSSLELFSQLRAKVGTVSPEAMQYEGKLPVQSFSDLQSGLKWADVVIGLRVQKERNSRVPKISDEDYKKYYRLDVESIQPLGKSALIMHPGPFVPGHDFDPRLLQDKRCRIHQQVENGVFIRMALLADCLSLWSKS